MTASAALAMASGAVVREGGRGPGILPVSATPDGAAIGTREAALAALLDALRLPACIVAVDGRIVLANAAAESARGLRAGATLRGHPVIRVLGVAAPREAEALARAVAGAATGGPGRIVLLAAADDRVVQACVSPLVLRDAADAPVRQRFALLLVRPLGAPPAEAMERLGVQLFGFTLGEAEAAAAVAAGSSPALVAKRKRVAVSTVRTLLERAQGKAGVANLRQLAVLLASLSV